MFIGEYQHNLDQKGRLAVPARFRSNLSQAAIITRGLDGCLFLFTGSEWKELAKKITSLPLVQANSRAFARLMLAGAMEVSLDTQGRILIPDYLRQYASLDKKIIITGVYDRLEIWDQDRWQEYKNKTESSSEEIAEKLADLGI